MSFLNHSISKILFVLSLLSLCLPRLFLLPIGGGLVFGHYLILMTYGFIALLQAPGVLRFVGLPVLLILASSLINSSDFSPMVAVFHCINLIWIALMAKQDPDYVASIVEKLLTFLVSMILVFAVMRFVGLHSLLPSGAFTDDRHTGQIRLMAFATEPAATGLILMILSRYLIVVAPERFTQKFLIMTLTGSVLMLSINGIVAGLLIILSYLSKTRNFKAIAFLLVCVAAGAAAVTQIGYFSERLGGLSLTDGVMGFGTGTIRLLPYVFLGEEMRDGVSFLFLGLGAGSFQNEFFASIGQYVTSHDTLSGHMAAAIYDYGVFFPLVILLLHRPANPLDFGVHVLATLLIFLNAGVGTYLFVLYGTFSLLQQKALRRAQAIS